MYNCQVCSSPSQPNGKALKIITYRDKLGHKEIAKELQVCQLCHDGHAAGMPLDRLATMHRPKPKVEIPPTYGPPHPLVGLGVVSSPKEEASPLANAFERLGQHAAQTINQAALDALLESRPDSGRTRKAPPLKAARQHQKVKYENRAKKQQQAKA